MKNNRFTRKACLLIAALMLMAAFAACAPQNADTYTVTFLDGTVAIKTVTVQKGAALTDSDVPPAPSGHSGETFLGYFTEDSVEVKAGFTPSSSVRATAKFASQVQKYTVTFNYSDEFTVSGIVAGGYAQGDSVAFALTINNAEKTLSSVTSEDVNVASIGQNQYGFVMPGKNVTITVTLQNVDTAGDDRLQLFTYGSLFVGGLRSLYCKLDDGLSGNLNWESDNPEVAAISTSMIVQGKMPEVMLRGVSQGTANIKCSLASDKTVFNTYKVTVHSYDEGTAMPAELYSKLESSLRMTSVEKLLDYDVSYNETVSKQNDIVTIFEEITDESTDLEPNNLTDAYQIEVKNGGKIDFAAKYVSNGAYVCEEYVDVNNEVHQKTVLDSENMRKSWSGSFYTNIFHARPIYSSAELWKSFDGGKTYRYCGSDNNAAVLCVFWYQCDISPDDMYIAVEGDNLSLTVTIDPANGTGSAKYGRRIETVFSEFGTAQIEHLTPYATETYHAQVTAARQKMAALRNYKATLTMDNTTYVFTFLEDTVDVVVKQYGTVVSHYGAHKVTEEGCTYYEYTYDEQSGELVKTTLHNTPWDGDNVNRYPAFDFASEIFLQSSENSSVFTSRSGTGAFVKKTCYMPDVLGYYGFGNDGTLVLDNAGYVKSVSLVVVENDGEGQANLTIEFSEYNEAAVALDFATAKDPVAPETWQQANSTLYAAMQKWNIPIESLPYVHTETGFDDVYPLPLGGGAIAANCAVIHTFAFADETARDQYIEEYKAALVAAGFTATGQTDENTNLEIYEKDGVKVCVGYSPDAYGKAKRVVNITVYANGIVQPA